MTVDGLWIPKAFLKPSKIGLKTLSTIQLPIPKRASRIPSRIPSTTFPPASLILSSKYWYASDAPCAIRFPISLASAPVIDPSAYPNNSSIFSAIAIHCIFVSASWMFVTIFDQSILWINSMSVSKKFRTRVDAAFESADQSRFSMKPTSNLFLHFGYIFGYC